MNMDKETNKQLLNAKLEDMRLIGRSFVFDHI